MDLLPESGRRQLPIKQDTLPNPEISVGLLLWSLCLFCMRWHLLVVRDRHRLVCLLYYCGHGIFPYKVSTSLAIFIACCRILLPMKTASVLLFMLIDYHYWGLGNPLAAQYDRMVIYLSDTISM